MWTNEDVSKHAKSNGVRIVKLNLRLNILFVTSNHQTTNFVFPNFSQSEPMKKKTQGFLSFGPMESLWEKFVEWGKQDS